MDIARFRAFEPFRRVMTAEPVERRALKVVSVTALSSISTIVLQILTVNICLRYWGNEKYGIWLALFSSFAAIQTIGSSYANFIGNKLNIQFHADQRELKATLGSALVGVMFIALLHLVTILILVSGHFLADIIGVPPPAYDAADPELALWILSASWIFGGFYLGIVHRLFIPTGLMYQAAWWSLASQVSLASVVVVAAVSRASLVQTAMLYAVVQFAWALGSAWYIRYRLPQFYPWTRGFDLRLGLRDLAGSLPQIFSGLMQQGAANGLVLLVSAVASAAAVPVFTTVRTMANLWTNLANILTTPLLPDIVRFHAKQESEKLVAIYEIHGVLVGTAVNLSILLVYPLIPAFYAQWTNHAVPLSESLLCAMLGMVSLFNLGSLMSTFLIGINHREAILSTTIARGAISMLFGAAMLYGFGIGGLGFAIWLAEIVAVLLYAYFFVGLLRGHGGSGVSRTRLLFPLLGIGSLHVFLAAAAFDWGGRMAAWGIALAGVCTAGYVGWSQLDTDVRDRMRRLLVRRT